MSQNISAQQAALLRQIKQKQGRINQIFKEIDLKTQDVINTNKARQIHQSQENNNKNLYLTKYNNYSIDSIRKNYENAIPFFSWTQLPFCTKIIYQKLVFFIPTNAVLALSYLLWKKALDNKLKFNLKQFAKSYFSLSLVTCSLVLAESLLFQPYCDINSHHYRKDLSNKQIAKLLQKQYQRYDGKK